MFLPRPILPIALVFLMIFAERSPLRADTECIRLSGNQLLNDDHFEFVFDGTAVEAERVSAYLIRSTVTVHRVWKGAVTQRFVVYGRGQASEGNMALEKGTRYVVSASRRGPDVPDGGVLTLACGVIPYRYAGELLRELGPGKPLIR